MLLFAQRLTPTQGFALVAGVLILSILGIAIYLLLRWTMHLLGLRHAVASSFAPIDVQVMRCVDLLRAFLQDPTHRLIAESQIGELLRDAHAQLRQASRHAAMHPEKEHEIQELHRAIAEMWSVFQPLVDARDTDGHSQEIAAEFAAAWQRLQSVQGHFRTAVEQYNRALRHPIGRLASIIFRFEVACPLGELPAARDEPESRGDSRART